MSVATLVICIHNHQPVGNLPGVFEDAYERAYLPFLEAMEAFPDVKIVLHNSGPLLEWYEEHAPDYLDRVRALVARGQVEVLGGAFYEPILSSIPERDALGQIRMMSDYVRERFGVEPRGMWLAERVWEPRLAKTIGEAGVEYLPLDDYEFRLSGLEEDALTGCFVTEDQGVPVRVFPISKRLRYAIPFAEPDETLSLLRETSSLGERAVAVFGDDGEKFGVWPGTHAHVHRGGWLKRFFETLVANADWLSTATFSDVVSSRPPVGRVYLPTSSYPEMMEWALPLRAQETYREAKEVLERSGRFPEAAEVVRGGFWRNFLVKYEESNWMHKRMLRASAALDAAAPAGDEGRSHLYQAQCNCAYWHGLFGGLYLPHLRSAIFHHIHGVEAALERPALERGDIDGDGAEEVVLSTPGLQAFFKARGGVLRELDDMSSRFNLCDTLTRREEIYHRDLGGTGKRSQEDEGAVSIHDLSAAKEEGLEKRLFYDRWPKASLSDRFMPTQTTLEEFASGSYRELGDFAGGLYGVETEGESAVVFSRGGLVSGDGPPVPVRVEKRISLDGKAGLKVDYAVTAEGEGLGCLFAVENVFSFLAGNAPDRYFEIPGRKIGGGRHLASMGVEEDTGIIRLVDEWLGISLALRFDPPATVWRYPVETVSNSDSGFERVYQGSAVVVVRRLDLGPGETERFTMRMGISKVS